MNQGCVGLDEHYQGCAAVLLNTQLQDDIEAYEIEALFEQLATQDEFASEFYFYGPKTRPFRVVARVACVNSPERLGKDQNLERSLMLSKRYLGNFCASDALIKRDGFRAIAVSLSLATRRIVSPKRAWCCFARKGNQDYALTGVGEHLLKSNNVAWPPSNLPLLQLLPEPPAHDNMVHPGLATGIPFEGLISDLSDVIMGSEDVDTSTPLPTMPGNDFGFPRMKVTSDDAWFVNLYNIAHRGSQL